MIEQQNENYNYDDFTEANYRKLIRMAKRKWSIISYQQYKILGKACLWRHDVDFSINRALKIASIENAEEIRTTYFIHLHSVFYHPLDPESADKIKQIIAMGHNLGLHFDVQFYRDLSFAGSHNVTGKDILHMLRMEKEILENTFDYSIRVFSLHNPDFDIFPRIDDDEVEGMINAYSCYLRKNYFYVSDSNGHWRFKRLSDILEEGEEERIHVLTHPGWWTPDPMSPRDRISRCIEGRAKSQHLFYDRFHEESGRENIGIV